MNIEIIFCNDGVLRVYYSDDYPLVNLSTFQDKAGEDDLTFMPRFWDEIVRFEDGLTISKFLMCLRPWIKFWSAITRTDIAAYLAESRKPHLMTEEDKAENWYAILSTCSEIKPEISFNKHRSDFESFEEYFNAKIPPTIKPFWDIEKTYKLTAHQIGIREHWGVDDRPMNTCANWPLYLSPYHMILPMDYNIKSSVDDVTSIINREGIGIRTEATGYGGGAVQYILGKQHHTLRGVIEGFFEMFSRSPFHRDALNDSIREQLAGLDLGNMKFDDESEEEEVSTEDEKEPDDAEKATGRKVVFAPGAFDDMISAFDRERDAFVEAIEFAKKSKVVGLRVGKPKEQIIPEKRISMWVIEDEDVFDGNERL